MKENLKCFLKDNEISYYSDYPMKKHSTFKIGGNASLAIFPQNEVEASKLVLFLNNNEEKYITFGNCSNVIIDDRGIDYPVILTNNLKAMSIKDETLTCGAGVLLSSAAIFAYENSLAGFEFAHGIPGSIGGGVYMNAGAYGNCLSDVILNTVYVTGSGEIKKIGIESHEYGYRKSIFCQNDIIINSSFSLKYGDKTEIKAKIDDYLSRRKNSQPLEYPSAGSVFKRPVGYYAGALIDQSGLKGYSIGDAQVSEKHAGFIINKGSASAEDVKQLISHIQKTVYDNFGVLLETEVKIIPWK